MDGEKSALMISAAEKHIMTYPIIAMMFSETIHLFALTGVLMHWVFYTMTILVRI